MKLPAENSTQTGELEQSDETGAANEVSASEEVVASPRMTAMERIAEQRRMSLAEDGVDMTGMEGTKEIPKDADIDQLAAQLGQDDRVTHFASETARVRVKVDGEELDLPLSEVVKSYQKDSAASKRLQEATRLLQIAEQKANNIAQSSQEVNNSLAHEDPDPAAKEGRISQVKGVFSKLYEGDEEGAAEEMLRLIDQGANKATQAPIDPNRIASQVRQQLAVEDAYVGVKSDYPDIFSDTERGVILGKETFSRMNAKEAQGFPRAQAMKEAVEEVAELFGIEKAGRQKTAQTRTVRDTKLERKAVLDIPETANVVAGNKQSAGEVQNVSSVIAEMARARLGQSLNARG